MKNTMPRVYLIARPRLEELEIGRFLEDRILQWKRTEHASETEELVEIAGRICYLSFTNDTNKIRFPNGAYLENLIRQGHESVLEHANWSMIIDGVSRAFTHQLVRHRVGFSFSQLSQQYHEESNAEFVEPAGLDDSPVAAEIWRETVVAARNAYQRIIAELSSPDSNSDREARRLIRSAARSLLPNATQTTIVVTANARSLRHFFTVRGAIEGDIEMRRVAAALFRCVSREAPALFGDFELFQADDGDEMVRSKRAARNGNSEQTEAAE